MRRCYVVLAVTVVTVTFACVGACSSQDEEPSPTELHTPSETSVSTPFPSRTEGGGDPGTDPVPDWAASLRSVLEYYRIAIVARVDGIVGQWDDATPYTVFQLDVQQVITGQDVVTEGTANIPWLVDGGSLPDGYIPLLEPPTIGRTYLFLFADVHAMGLPGFGAPPSTRFEVSDDGHIIPNGWDGEPGIRAISGISEEQYLATAAQPSPRDAFAKLVGQSLENAISAIQAAADEAPLPPFPDAADMTPTPLGQTPVPYFTPSN